MLSTSLSRLQEIEKTRPGKQLKINPNRWVHVLLWNDGAMYECAAITIFLCDRHIEANLAPAADAPERSLFLQTLIYFSSCVQTAFQPDYHAHRFADTPAYEPSAQKQGYRRLRETWKVIDDKIGDNRWIPGDQFHVADIYPFMLTTWLKTSLSHPDVSEFPNI